MAEHFDLLILGSGSTAFAAALRAAELGKSISLRHVQRIMQRENLQVRTRRRRKWVARPAIAATSAARPDETWAMDLVSEWCVGVRRQLRILTMIDCCTRETLALRAGYSMPSKRVVDILEQLRRQGRKPAEIRVDNGLNASNFLKA